MFGLFGKRKPKTALDAAIIQMYGSLQHKKTANVEAASKMAFDDLLFRCIDEASVKKHAIELFASPMPYSTIDLAVSVSLFFFRDPVNYERLESAQLGARLKVLEWVKSGEVNASVAAAFENSLYTRFKPRR